MDENTANNVAQAIAVSLDWSSSPDARKAALSYLESVSFTRLCFFSCLIVYGCEEMQLIVFLLGFFSLCMSGNSFELNEIFFFIIIDDVLIGFFYAF